VTLCVAWNTGRNIHFASDSRITSGYDYSDNAIKIIPVPIHVYEPNDSDTGQMPTLFHQEYGMCFAGSFLGGYVIREFMVCTLQRLQCIPNFMDLSFYQICRSIYKFYEYLVHVLYQDLQSEHSIDFFVAGFCPNNRRLEIAKFFIQYNAAFTDFTTKWTLIDNTTQFVEALGAGDNEFQINYRSLSSIPDRNNRIMHAIKKTIDEQKVKSVGGNIQYGTFDCHNVFSTSGIVYREYNKDGLLKKIRHCIAGIDMMEGAFDPKDDELFIMGSFIDPFWR
jgi:hypothetical protein